MVVDHGSEDGTGRDFVDHWNWAAEKGLLNRNTANALRAAVQRVLSVEGQDWESINVRSIDIDSLLDRFENLAKKEFAPGSLAAYRSRFLRALSLYLSYLDDPRNYRPQLRERSKTGERATSARSRVPRTRAQGASTLDTEAIGTSTSSRMIRYPFPVRQGIVAEILLPVDLQKDEATRLCTFINSLALEDSPPRTKLDPTTITA